MISNRPFSESTPRPDVQELKVHYKNHTALQALDLKSIHSPDNNLDQHTLEDDFILPEEKTASTKRDDKITYS